jgi:hypothetical protein
MNDEYQTQYFWNNMKKSELKELVKEQLFKALLEKDGFYNDGPASIDGPLNDPNHFEKAMDNLGMRAGVEPSTGANKFRAKKYKVRYWTYDQYGGDPEVIEVEASSEEEALKKAKQEAPRASSKFKII